MAVKTSGAPFANAKNVTPANVGDISRIKKVITKFINKLLDSFGQVVIVDEIDECKQKIE